MAGPAIAKVLDKQRKNREKRKTRQQNKKKKGKKNKGSNKNVKPGLRADGLGNLETPTQVCEVQTTSAPQTPALKTAGQAFGVHVYCTHQVSGVMDLSVEYFAHDLLSVFYGQRCCDKSNRGM